MREHYIVTLDRGHLRIYAERSIAGQTTPRLEVVEAMDFPGGVRRHAARAEETRTAPTPHEAESQEAIRQRRHEADRRNVEVLVAELDTFFENRPDASWDFASAPSLYETIINRLAPETTRRLKRALSKDLVHQRADDVQAHFVVAGR